VETQEYSSHVISGSKLHAAHVVRWSETVWGCLLTDGDFTKWRQAMRTHGTQSRSMLCVVRNSCVRDLRHIAGWSKDVIYQMIRSIRKLTHIVANRGAGEQ